MGYLGCLERPEDFQFDVFPSKVLEEAPALAEQHRDESEFQLVEQPSPEALLGGVGAVQQDVAPTLAAALGVSMPPTATG